MRPGRPGAFALGILGLAALGAFGIARTHAQSGETQAALSPDLDQGNSALPAAPPTDRRHAAPPPLAAADTPMAERVAVIGVLNKRDGAARDVTLKPGQAVRVGPLVVRLRACETTADWEPEQLTGALVQADLLGRDRQWRRIFSGWLYKESPSLNAVENPYFDVWPKSCTMRHAETGADTVAASSPAPRSSAKKSAGEEKPAAGDASPSALSNSAT